MTAIDDTLILPFVDDFSRQGMYPYEGLWLDSNAYVNTNYGDLPPTIGVATFDGIDKNGVPYNVLATQDASADTLTSKPLDLAVVAGDTSIWLSFFYQPQGLGDVPETKDSFLLELKDTSNTWNEVWSLAGRPDTAFQRANIHILDGKYFFRGFQFRFRNIATINGNRDHWNLDYVILRQFGAPNDSIADNALIYPQRSLLNEFTAMPYTHYKSLASQQAALKTSISDTIHDLNYGGTSYIPQLSIFENGSQIFNNSIGAISSPSSMSYVPYAIPLNSFTYPNSSGDSADFLVKSYFTNTGAQSNLYNDTSYFTQHFYNYYAYDDGTAEVGYGLQGNADIEMAYKFNVTMRDTLVGVQIYFNPVGIDVTNKLFQLCAWSSISVSQNSSTLIYRRINQKPGPVNGINGFKTFTFDSLIIVDPGTVYVGIIQNEPGTPYGIGFDHNTDSRGNMFIHIDGSWAQSTQEGSWMIRPVFGSALNLVGAGEVSKNRIPFSLYPDPATDRVTIRTPSEKTFSFTLTDILGNVILRDRMQEQKTIELNGLAQGMYFIRLFDEHNSGSTQKFIVR